jgi:PAS domain S-box-containing protein
MKYQYIPIMWPLMISGIFTLFLGFLALIKFRKASAAKYFIISMFVVTLWSIPNALEMCSVDLSTKLFWANVQYFAYCYSPVTLLVLSMQFTGCDRWIKSKKVLLLALLPTIIVLLAWTDQWHGLLRYDIHLDYSGEFPVIAKRYGYMFYVHAAYSHILNLSAVILLVRAVFFKNSLYRKQAIPLLIGICFIMLPNLFYITGLSRLNYDITPVFFGPAGCIMLWAIFRYKMFDLIPIARAHIIEGMDAGFVVLDIQDRIMDLNPAFVKLCGLSSSQILHKNISEIDIAIPELVRVCKEKRADQAEFSVTEDQTVRYYEILITPLKDNKRSVIGRLAVIYDITEKKRVQEDLMKQQWMLAISDERERMARDLHDNLGQVLGFINFQAQAINQTLINQGNHSVSDKMQQLLDITQSAHSELREYISSIRLNVSKETDFISALRKEVTSFEHQTGISVQLGITGSITGHEFTPGAWLQILNILREALNNIRKHAEARRVLIVLELNNQQLSIEIADDGMGFLLSPKRSPVKTKFGLDIMKERAAMINGQIKIDSVQGQGTNIMLTVPISEEGGKTHEGHAG